MSSPAPRQLRRRADYTHKHNAKSGRHGWLRLTPAYSVKIVDELLSRHHRPRRVLDPFCGTATTALSAAHHGHHGVTLDINPFLVWLGNAKTARYSGDAIESARAAGIRALGVVRSGAVEPAAIPPIHNVERWWDAETLQFLCALQSGIEAESEAPSPERDLLLVAFCRTLIGLSQAAFHHQSMSFRDRGGPHLPFAANPDRVFRLDLEFVLDGAADNPPETAQVLSGDARRVPQAVRGPFDLIITSPPYANRMSYIRELRPYMYWLGFLDNGRDAGEMDWLAIGGTWGVATSRLADWDVPENGFQHPLLRRPLGRIAHGANRNGALLAKYIARYFQDIWKHIQSLPPVLETGSEVHYIVGNSTFYGELLPVEQIYAAMLAETGFGNVQCSAIRKRNSKKELFEFDVSARWPGRSPVSAG